VSDRSCPSERKKVPLRLCPRVTAGLDLSKASFVYVSGWETRNIVDSWQMNYNVVRVSIDDHAPVVPIYMSWSLKPSWRVREFSAFSAVFGVPRAWTARSVQLAGRRHLSWKTHVKSSCEIRN